MYETLIICLLAGDFSQNSHFLHKNQMLHVFFIFFGSHLKSVKITTMTRAAYFHFFPLSFPVVGYSVQHLTKITGVFSPI